MSGPYWNQPEPDVPDYQWPTGPATCLLCGLEETTDTIWLKPAWWREPGPDGKQITTVPRCRDAGDCRARVEANGEPWPLLERGEEPGRKPPGPIQPPTVTPPDAKEADLDWHF